MKMKCKRLTASVLVAVLLLALLPAVSPPVSAGSESEWILASEAPSWARITQRKYTYDLTTTTESKETSLAGYTQTGSYWVQSGSGAAHYATFPSGFDQTHAYYTGWRKSAFAASETQTAKRTVSNSWAGYVYWHWMYDTNYANGTSGRAIYNKKGTGANGYGYKFFGAFVSTKGDYSSDTGYCNNLGIRNYIVPERTSWDQCQGSTRWFRFDYYTSSYVDYYKMFQYKKVEHLESTSEPSGTGVSNVQEWVKYLLQTGVRFDVNHDDAPVNRMRAPTVEAGWTLGENGTLSLTKEGVSLVYDPSDESFTFDTGGQAIAGKSIALYRFSLEGAFPAGSYVNLSVRKLGGSQTLEEACLVLEGAPSDSFTISEDRCTMGVYPPSNGGWYTISEGPLTESQSQKLDSILIWLWADGSAQLDQLKVQFSVSVTDGPLSASEIRETPLEKSVFCEGAYGTLPQPRRTGYSFAGWYTQKNGGERVTEETVMSRNEPHTLYAAWTANSYSLHLDAQGGTVESPVTVTYDKPVGQLPVPLREGYHFLGWYTEPNGGTLVEAEEVVAFTEDRTVYACWILDQLLSCGEGLSWELKGNRLVISGSGGIMDYNQGESPFTLLSGYIRELVIEKDVTAVGTYAFANVASVPSLILPDTVERLGQGALSGCTSLKSLRVDDPCCQLCELPETLTQISGYTGSTAEAYSTDHGIPFQSLGFYQDNGGFSYRYQEETNTLFIEGSGALPDYAVGEAPWYAKRLTLETVEISGNITYIGNNSFAGCGQLSAVSLPKTVKSYGENVFEDTLWYRSKPEGVVILNGVVYGLRAGQGEYNLVLSGGTAKIESNFSLSARQGETGLRSLQISSSVTEIEDGALSWFPQLEELTVQRGNTAYQTVDHVLYTKDMKQLVCYPGGREGEYRLPESVVQIRPYAFAGCKDLTELYLGSQLTRIGTEAFADSGLQTIHGYYDSYSRQYAEENGYTFLPYTTTVTLDSNNDSEEITTVEVYTGCALGALPTPAQEGYRFLGWFLETESEDLLITGEYVVTEDITLLAFWEELPVQGPYLESLSILTLPAKQNYFSGETVLTEGLSLLAHYSDGTVETVTEALPCVPSRVNKPGNQLITVYYAGLSASFTVQVTEVVPVSLTLVSLPKVLTYYVTTGAGGESPLDPRGLVGLVEFNNGTQRLISNSAEFEYVYDLSKAADSSTVNVNYRQGDVVVAAFYQVRVLEKPRLYSENTSGKTGEEISVPIYISGNTGLMGLGVELSYDPSVLVPESISGSLTGTMGWNKGYGETGKVKILWSHSEEFSDDGLLFTVNFRILSQGAAGDSTITLSYMEEDSFNESYESVQLVCSPVTVQIEQVEKPAFYAEALTAKAGELLDVPLYIKNNVGVEDLSIFTLNYDAAAFEYLQQAGDSDAVFKITQQESKLKLVLNAVPEEREDGLLFTLRFRVKTEAAGSYSFTCTVDDSRWECQDVQIQVTAKALRPTVSAQAQTGAPGESVAFPVELTENPGLMGYHLRLSYDPSVLTVTGVTPNTGWGGNFDFAAENGVLDVLWTHSENVTINGLLFTLHISAATAGDYHLQWEAVAENTYNEAWEGVALQCEPTSLKAEPVVLMDSSIVMNHTLNLASDISVNFAVKASLLKNYVNHYLVCEIPVYNGDTQAGTQSVTIEPTVNGSYYYYTLTGLTAVQMGDVVTAQLHMEKDGQSWLSPVDTYSVARYAYSQLDKAAASATLKTLCADLLRYGTEAQIYKNYRTGALADESMTEAHRAYLSDGENVAFGNTNETLSDLENPAVTWVGKSLSLESKVSVKYIFTPASYKGRIEDLTLKVSYVNLLGEPAEALVRGAEVYNAAANRYSFTFDGLLAAELRSVVDVAVYQGETQLSRTLRYSPDTYGNNKTGQLLILCKALFAYSDSAKAYFAS